MNDQQNIIGALAMDLKRVAMSTFNGSDIVADRFWKEAQKRKSEIEMPKVPGYIENLLNNLNNKKDYERLLMYSILLQNYSQNGKQK